MVNIYIYWLLIYVSLHSIMTCLFQWVSKGKNGFTKAVFFTKICPMNVWIKNNSYYTTILLITCAGLTSCPSKFNKWEQNPHFLSVIIILPCVLHLFSLSVTSAITWHSNNSVTYLVSNVTYVWYCAYFVLTADKT